MPRKDRRFTGDDVRRIYCRHLTPTQRFIFDRLTCNLADLDEQEIAQEMVSALSSPPLSYLWDVLPYGHYVSHSLDAIALLLDNRPADVGLYLAPWQSGGYPGAG